eukprot:TRINITY_DN923_c0_g1_i1.p1 TRINITY_DN923_c0_g1~~TRINITY_DN923_c0_g1_i1.p1  ORF type:complete len:665 (+),score=82.14 TRINITY_DN923_c0_g1_i1:451-2445(+)
MPALVNYVGEGPLYSNLMDSSLFLSLGPHMDLYCPPPKRSRISVPFVFKEAAAEQQKQRSLDDLPDECLFEIFRRLPGGQERSTCACVSKRWLILQSSIQRAEICPASRSVNSLKLVGEFDSDKADDVSATIHKGGEQISSDTEEEEKEIESDGYLTRCLEGKKATDVRLAAIAVGTYSRGGLGKLMIRGSNLTRGVTDLGLSAIARGCPSLRVLSLWNISSFGDEGLCKIANGCRMLEKLDLSSCPLISDKGLVAIAKMCPNLASVTIESCSKVGNGSLQAIGQSCPNLKSILVKDCPLVGDQGIASLVSSASSVLTKINLHALNITDASLAVIGHYGKAVTDLKLTGLHNVSERGFWVMGNTLGLQKLKSFAIALCPGLTDLGLEAVGKGCPNLKQLCLRGCYYLSDSGLKAFTKIAASLENLQLEECNRITQVGVLGALSNCGTKLKTLTLVNCMGIRDDFSGLDLFSPCRSLRSLSIRNCSGFGSASLATVGKLCPHVQHVDLSGLPGLTDAGLLALLLSRESGLLKVNLSGCINLTDEAVSAMARLYGETLQLLNLDGCGNITDKSLIAIAKHCTSLYDLDVSVCAVTDLGVAALARATELNLQILSLSCCSQVSDRSLLFLGELGQALVGLNLQHCNLVSAGAVELLGEQLWGCDILS